MAEALTGTELTCREIIDFLMAYLDGELPACKRTIFDLHLSICEDCRNYLDSYQSTIELERKLAGESVLPLQEQELPFDLIKAILASRDQT